MNKKTKLSSGVVALQRISESKLKLAKSFRKEMTPAETLLWEHIRNKQLNGLKFRRQQIIEGFIVDFFCHELKLVIEIDGNVHNEDEQKEIDEHRKKVFELRGLKELRFTNDEVLHDISSVLKKIKAFKDTIP